VVDLIIKNVIFGALDWALMKTQPLICVSCYFIPCHIVETPVPYMSPNINPLINFIMPINHFLMNLI
jgi:hypothetical protein